MLNHATFGDWHRDIRHCGCRDGGIRGGGHGSPARGEDALDAVNQLRAQGYSVSVHVTNGPREVPLSERTVLDVSGLNGTNSPVN